eukprot:Seg775.1 transcript_id=Seg775.1/GoldUCD/mRNA.D3Y31 product="hypothetical protein" protein_id=Seg775.1/GoldUCD/D3Y31
MKSRLAKCEMTPARMTLLCIRDFMGQLVRKRQLAKYGTMSEMMYQRKLVITEKTNFASGKNAMVDAEQTDNTENEIEETELQCDSSTDEEDGDATNSELDARSTFLVGVSTR